MINQGFLFIHKFYQNNPKDGSHDYREFYHSQRECIAAFRTISVQKGSMYRVECFDIVPLEDFKYKGVATDNTHQYKLKETFLLRKHKKRLNSFDNTLYYFDVKTPGRPWCEEFKKITEEEYNKLKNKC